ncbi:hypothetical protein BH09MYX1_BH09MYX1_62810 [soil metagenome]
MTAKADLLNDLRGMLRDVLIAKEAGHAHARLARAHGYVDGFMKALLDSGLATKTELLELVASERERISGPALRTLSEIDDSETAAA